MWWWLKWWSLIEWPWLILEMFWYRNEPPKLRVHMNIRMWWRVEEWPGFWHHWWSTRAWLGNRAWFPYLVHLVRKHWNHIPWMSSLVNPRSLGEVLLSLIQVPSGSRSYNILVTRKSRTKVCLIWSENRTK